jgi:hypothetical protein
MSNDSAERHALRGELPFIESFSLVDLLRAFGRESIDAEQTKSLILDQSGRSTAHQVAGLDLLRAWCAFQRYGIEHSIGNGDVMSARLPDGTVFDEVRFSGHSTVASLMRQALGLCDRFGWPPPMLPCRTADLSDSAKTLNCVAAIEQWSADKLDRPRSRPLSPQQIGRTYDRDWRVVREWIDGGEIWAEAIDSKNYRIAIANLPIDWESRL